MLQSALVASAHHILAFAMVGLLVSEIVLVRDDVSADAIKLVGRIDIAYGVVFVALLVLGLLRVFLTEKGWDNYASSYAFWSKLAFYLTAAALSVRPTLTYLQWGRALKQNPTFVPQAAEVRRMRLLMVAQLMALVPVPILAAFMARGMLQFAP